MFQNSWRDLLAFASEGQRETALRSSDLFDLPGTLQDAEGVMNMSLLGKGRILETLLEDRRLVQASLNPAVHDVAQQADTLKARLRAAAADDRHALAGEEKEKVLASLEVLQKKLAGMIFAGGAHAHSEPPSILQVQRALSSSHALVDFVTYRKWTGQDQFDRHYAALVLRSNHPPQFRDLGRAQDLEEHIAEYRKHVSPSASGQDAPVLAAAQRLFADLIAPLQSLLSGGVKECILVPDGQLHFVPFAALVDRDGRFWGESKRLSYMSSCRDILRKASPLGQGGSAVLLGNPDYQNKAPLQAVPQRGGATEEERHRKDAATELKRRMGRDFRDVTFGPLEGTEKEVAGLKQRFDAKGWQVRTLLDADASEPALQRLTHPAFLHLATHGFFLDEFGATKTDKAARGVGIGSVLSGGTPAARDPMMRSGLALSGAQTTVTLWQKGEVPPLEQDGILAAAEAAGLDLGGTFLVTLSACDTGLGEARSGEGVMGMKRGLALAGAENLLMTLWPISDLDTVALMAAFYDRVLSGEHPARALHSAQMEAMVRLRRERGLYRAITLAAPFVLVGGTALP